MQNVSNQYKQSIRRRERNRGYIRVVLGLYNLQAQKHAQVSKEKNDLLYFSNVREPFLGGLADRIYATPEQGFSRVDGSMYFAPPVNAGYDYYNNGIVSNAILGNIYIDFGGEEYDIKGLSIDFGDYYPVDFTIKTDRDEKSYRENDKRYWRTEDVFDKTTFIQIRPARMVNGAGRLRILRFSCGITNTFTNEEVIRYSGKEYISPICETLPSNDVRLTVANYNSYYSPDNPGSALAYMETGQEIRVAFGYDVDGNGDIEWLPEKLSYLKEWSANESEAQFTSTDIFDHMTGIYYRGTFREEGISLYDLATDVFADAGITNYFIDSYLKEITVRNPVPAVSHSVALQMIANAGRSVLLEDRKGMVVIYPAFVPEMESDADNQTWYSNAGNILKDEEKIWYATASKGFTAVDGSMKFLPGQGNDLLHTGYISESVWRKDGDAEGYWDRGTPKIILRMESTYTVFGIGIRFQKYAPEQIYINTYQDGELLEQVVVDEPGIDYRLNHDFLDFDQMELVFTKGIPNARIFVSHVTMGENTDYRLRRTHELISAPVAVRQNKIKDISVSFHSYKETPESVVVASEEITVPYDGYEHLVYFKNPSYGLFLFTSDNNGAGNRAAVRAEMTESSNYYAKIRFTGVTEETVISYSISGYEYSVEEQRYVDGYNGNGESKAWSNPLVSTQEHAKILEEWIAAYLLGDVDYQMEWTGDPSVDANDLFELETKYGNVFVKSYENTLYFNGRWTGSMKARKVVE